MRSMLDFWARLAKDYGDAKDLEERQRERAAYEVLTRCFPKKFLR